jgi:anthranilate synthase
VTVTGAPKLWAIRFIEEEERSARRWYGGAIGRVTFDGHMNTGLTLSTMRMKDGIAEVRAGATLLFDSDPDAEEAETRLKAAALIAAIRGPGRAAAQEGPTPPGQSARGRKVLLIDHEDSFVHTLAGYIRTTGAEVTTLRHDFARAELKRGLRPDLAMLSPGPGRPEDFAIGETLDLLLERGIPVFGVCLGLQGIIEYFGGSLGVLDVPMHGKPSIVRALPGRLLRGLPERFTIGRYHSLYAVRRQLPPVLSVVAETEDDRVIMAIEHKSLPIAAVQFHPESVMTSPGEIGMPIIENALALLCEPVSVK